MARYYALQEGYDGEACQDGPYDSLAKLWRESEGVNEATTIIEVHMDGTITAGNAAGAFEQELRDSLDEEE